MLKLSINIKRSFLAYSAYTYPGIKSMISFSILFFFQNHMPVPSKDSSEQSCISVLELSMLPLFTIAILNFENVETVQNQAIISDSQECVKYIQYHFKSLSHL